MATGMDSMMPGCLESWRVVLANREDRGSALTDSLRIRTRVVLYACRMAIRKNVQKHGNGHMLILSKESMQQLGLPDGGVVIMEFIGDTLLVRREGAEPADPLKVMVALGNLEAAFPAELKESMQRLLLVLRAYGPLGVEEAARHLGLTRGGAAYSLGKALGQGLVTRVGEAYGLPEG